MLKRALLATAAGLSILPVALAAPLTFTNVLNEIVKFLGPQGLDLLFAFGIVTTILYIATANVSIFQKSASSKAGGAMFAMIAGLATAFYVYINKIPFLALIGPYLLLIVAVFLGLLLISFAKSMVEGKSLASMLGVYGLGLLVIGMLMTFLSPDLWWGALIAIFGAFLMVIGGVSWISGGSIIGGFGAVLGRQRFGDMFRDSKGIERDTRSEFRDIASEAKINAKITAIVTKVESELIGIRDRLNTNPPDWTYAQSSIGGIKTLLVDTRDFLNAEMAKAQDAVNRADNALARAEAEERKSTSSVETLLKDAEKRFNLIEAQVKKIDNLETALINDSYADLEKLAAELASKNFAASNILIQDILARLNQIKKSGLLGAVDIQEMRKTLVAVQDETHDAELAIRQENLAIADMASIYGELDRARTLVNDAKISLSHPVNYPQAIQEAENAYIEITSALNLIKAAETAKQPNVAFTEIQSAINQIEVAISQIQKVEHVPVPNAPKEIKFDQKAIDVLTNALQKAKDALAKEQKASGNIKHS